MLRRHNKNITLGAVMENPGAILIYNETLGEQTYTKLLLSADGECMATNCPVDLLMNNKWRVWELRDAAEHNVYIAYQSESTNENKFWSKLRDTMGFTDKIPQMFGDLVVFRYCRPVMWNELQLRRELNNWLIMRYRHGDPYKFCDL